MDSFAQRFKHLRENVKHWTQEEVADKLGVSRSTIAGYESENKGRVPRQDMLKKIAEVFGISVDYLITGWTLGSYMSTAREARGMSIGELAETTGVPESTIIKIESATDNVNIHDPYLLALLANALSDDPIQFIVKSRQAVRDLAIAQFDEHGKLRKHPVIPLNESNSSIAPEEREFLDWVKDNLESSFFYDFDKSPEDSKREMMETLRFIWEREKRRKPGQKQGE